MEVALEAGADDVISTEEGHEVRCAPTAFDRVLQAVDKAGIRTLSSEVAYIPTSTVPVGDAATARALLALQEMFEDYDDIQGFFSNEELAEGLGAD